MNWPKSLIKKIHAETCLARYTSFKIGGPAQFFFIPENQSELKEAIIFAAAKKIPVHILGAGSNILASDKGVKGLVIKIDGKFFKELYNEGSDLICSSGVKLSRLILFAKEKGLSGLEFLSGIPGSLGGSIAGNAGAWGNSIGDFVEQVFALDYNGNSKTLSRRQLKFNYRSSNLAGLIILGARFKLKKKNKKQIALEIRNFLSRRAKNQKDKLPNAGCIFKNPSPQSSAGKLIDLCGLKGKMVNQAVISRSHANFILNLGGARSKDVLRLINLARLKVKNKFGVFLENEIKLWV